VKSFDKNLEIFEEPGQDGKAAGHAMFVVGSPALVAAITQSRNLFQGLLIGLGRPHRRAEKHKVI
jgi:hypothetical protein